MTKKEMVDRVQAWLGLQSIDDFNELPLVENMLYRGTIDLLARTRCVARCVHLRTQANVGVYTLDHSILALVDVDDGATRRARRDQGDWAGTFTLIRSDILRLNPTPTVDGIMDCWSVMRPQKMAADTDSPGMEAFGAIPEEFQDAIELYTLWRCSDYSDDASAQMGERYRLQYEGQDGRGGRLQEIRRLVNKRGTGRAAPRRVSLAPVGYRGLWVG